MKLKDADRYVCLESYFDRGTRIVHVRVAHKGWAKGKRFPVCEVVG